MSAAGVTDRWQTANFFLAMDKYFMAEELWLNYFNRYLFEHGTISEREYYGMIEKIAARTAKRCVAVKPAP